MFHIDYSPISRLHLLGLLKGKKGKRKKEGGWGKKERFTLQDFRDNRRDNTRFNPSNPGKGSRFSLSLSLSLSLFFSYGIRIVHYHIDEALLKRAVGHRGLSRLRFVCRAARCRYRKSIEIGGNFEAARPAK